MNTNNSISTIIKQLLEVNVNSLKTFERINEAVTTDKKNIPLEILNEEGSTSTVYIPSFGYMQRELERLDTNFKALTGLGTGSTKVKLADGTYQRVFTSTLKTPSTDITTLNSPVNFSVKPNYFFEDFLSPLLTASFDVSGQIPTDTERVLVKRLIIDTASEVAKEWFDDNYRGRDGLDYTTVLSDLAANNIAYYNDEEVRDLPYRNTQFFGKFDVTSIDTVQRTVIVDGQSTTKNVKLYTLDKLTYSDNEKDFTETEVLKVGDDLMVNSGNKSTKYKIKTIDNSTNQVELELTEGYEPIRIGVNVLAVYKSNDTTVNLEINLGFDERLIVFFKAIDPYSKILAENWSPGAAVYSNELTVTEEDGTVKTLAEYYKETVADFGQFIKALKDDAIPPATLGQTPDAPTLPADNFKVVQINTHLTQNDAANKVKRLNADKITVQESIKKLDDTLTKKRSQISTKKYKSNIERDRDRNELKSLIEQRASDVKLYGSLVNQIQSISSDSRLSDITPKFRVRGFWPIPEPKVVADTLPQNIVQFIVQYRYLSTSGKTSEVSQIKFTDGTEEKTAVFSNWNEIKTGVRKRARGIDGKFYWTDTAIEDGQEVNFNQLDLPIQSGELVEIRVKSVSEAGWPSNPVESDWSEVIQVAFPEGELDNTTVTNLVEENSKEEARVKLIEELESKGVYQHVDDSFIANEKYFAHTATTIASGFLSPEQNPVTLFDKLTEMQNEILTLKETISGIKGELAVKLVNEDGTIVQINRNTNNKVFAGYYIDEVAELTVKKGHIVTKTFKLLLENTRATTLELVARIIGDRDLPAYGSSVTGDTSSQYGFGTDYANGINNKVINDTYYTTEGKYDLVPIQYQSLTSSELAEIYNEESPYQSAQRRGQFVYSRYMDVANESSLYLTSAFNTSNVTGNITDFEHVLSYNTFESSTAPILLLETGDGTSSDYIWSGTFGNQVDSDSDLVNDAYDVSASWSNTSTASVVNVIDLTSLTVGSLSGGSAYDSGIFLHKDHPDLENIYASYQAIATQTTEMSYAEAMGALQTVIDSAAYTIPKTATLTAEDSSGLGKKQLGYKYTSGEITVGNRGLKMSFDANDQYLLGGKSCGSFLYIAPINSESLVVDGDNKFGRTYIKTGENNALSIDIVFQYRMTDYAGNDANSDLGRIGGIMSTNLSNLTYAKRIGIDIFDSDDEQFSFDLEVFAKYKAQGSNRSSVQAAQLVSNVPAVNFSF